MLLAGCLALSRGGGDPPVTGLERPEFDAAITTLALRDTPSSDGLWHNPTLRALAALGPRSADFAVWYLACGCRSAAESTVTVRAMYLLPLPDYLRFLHGLARLYDAHAVGPDVLAMAVRVPDAFGTDLQRRFADPAVRAELGAIAGRADVPSGVKDGIADLLAGRTWAQTRAFCRDRMFETVADCRTVGWLDLL
jgi:hypothetical protein